MNKVIKIKDLLKVLEDRKEFLKAQQPQSISELDKIKALAEASKSTDELDRIKVVNTVLKDIRVEAKVEGGVIALEHIIELFKEYE